MIQSSELRQDLVSGDWIVIAPGRANRSGKFKNILSRKPALLKGCVFENVETASLKKPILTYKDGKEWSLQIIENKFPAFTHHDVCSVFKKTGPYTVTDGVGHHDLVVTRDHHKDFPSLHKERANQVFEAFRDRYLTLLEDPCLAYISIFHNWGPSAGASVYHPHYQIISIPVVPPDIQHSLEGSRRFFKKQKACVHCAMIAWELRTKKRVIFQNEGAVAVAPFFSRAPFEVRVFPKPHLPYFENSYDHQIEYVVEALQESLRRVKRNLNDPDYNFFIHTAPLIERSRYINYHWHVEVIPKLSIFAGFELSTGLEINPVDPDLAAAILRKKK